ncbi:hypothetical protein BDZ97DRAFT_1829342 [Flammula alnicola]|nr:hypothetical protein BDZ97DRAFT_1829342 [Flammula alnicola]
MSRSSLRRASRARETNLISQKTSSISRSVAKTTTKTVTSRDWIAKNFRGKQLPALNSAGRTVSDPEAGEIYIYGGIRPGDGNEKPTADFYACDISTMEPRDLTKSFRFRKPYAPFSRAEKETLMRKLPILFGAALAPLHLNGRKLLLLFGGERYSDIVDPLAKDDANYRCHACSDLIAVDVVKKEWWVVKVEGGQIAPRINPVMVVVENKIFIFGGYKENGPNDTPDYLDSYSIAKYDHEAETWKWIASDRPYPDHVSGTIFGAGVPVYDGMQILLTPGRRKPTDRYDFIANRMWYFHTTHRTFGIAASIASGSPLPKNAFFYYLRHFEPPPNEESSQSEAGGSTRVRVHPYNSVGRRGSTAKSSSASSGESVIICAWVPRGPEYLVPEIWRFFLFPDTRVVCFNISDDVWKLDVDFQRFAVVGHRMFLIGYKGTDGESNDYEGSDTPPGAVCDTYVEIPIPLVDP